MKDGKVLVAGGWNDDKISNASYLFDPVDGKWRSVERTLRKRRGHSAVALADGRVRITGGWDGSGFLETAEIYDPAKNHWNKIGPMSAARFNHISLVLKDGRILVSGGVTEDGVIADCAEAETESGSGAEEDATDAESPVEDVAVA